MSASFQPPEALAAKKNASWCKPKHAAGVLMLFEQICNTVIRFQGINSPTSLALDAGSEAESLHLTLMFNFATKCLMVNLFEWHGAQTKSPRKTINGNAPKVLVVSYSKIRRKFRLVWANGCWLV